MVCSLAHLCARGLVQLECIDGDNVTCGHFPRGVFHALDLSNQNKNHRVQCVKHTTTTKKVCPKPRMLLCHYTSRLEASLHKGKKLRRHEGRLVRVDVVTRILDHHLGHRAELLAPHPHVLRGATDGILRTTEEGCGDIKLGHVATLEVLVEDAVTLERADSVDVIVGTALAEERAEVSIRLLADRALGKVAKPKLLRGDAGAGVARDADVVGKDASLGVVLVHKLPGEAAAQRVADNNQGSTLLDVPLEARHDALHDLLEVCLVRLTGAGIAAGRLHKQAPRRGHARADLSVGRGVDAGAASGRGEKDELGPLAVVVVNLGALIKDPAGGSSVASDLIGEAPDGLGEQGEDGHRLAAQDVGELLGDTHGEERVAAELHERGAAQLLGVHVSNTKGAGKEAADSSLGVAAVGKLLSLVGKSVKVGVVLLGSGGGQVILLGHLIAEVLEAKLDRR
mmetsp:Transcript_10461/g.24576  ORF Transcript_10461/g.24576 Transcript_10461/m.24576 type:complete len:454 (+) Transcript_10461:1853-3214(+)